MGVVSKRSKRSNNSEFLRHVVFFVYMNDFESLKTFLLIANTDERKTIHAIDMGIETPLILAAKEGYVECGQILLDAGIWRNRIFELQVFRRNCIPDKKFDFLAMVDKFVKKQERIESASGCNGSLAKACVVTLRQGFFSNPKQVFRHEGLPVYLAANKNSLGESVLPDELHRRLGLD